MDIQIDSREKAKAIQKIIKEFDKRNINYFSSKLLVGDYMNLDNPRLIIDRKQNLSEVCSNVTQQHERFKAELIRAHRSQVEGGKRYDRASEGRQLANATFLASHRTDRMSAAACAVDLTPVLSGADVEDYITGAIDRFREDVVRKIRSVRRG